ncbi:MAG: response regulator [Desulfobacteraceae bacterium]|nr:response regulator [Desulfobacteraceae bacterium]
MSTYTILVVDDENLMLELISKTLRPAGYEILTASSAEEGIALIDVNNVDLIISDHKMPGMTGIKFLQYIRITYPEILTILLTGYANLETAMDAINSAGVYKFMTKPLNLKELITIVKRAFEVKDLIKEKNLLINKVKSYESRLNELEKEYPGITHVTRDKNGNIVSDL